MDISGRISHDGSPARRSRGIDEACGTGPCHFAMLLVVACLLVASGPIQAETYSEIHKLTASDGAAGDRFGNPVAISGNTAVIGAAFDDDDGDSSGARCGSDRSDTHGDSRYGSTETSCAKFSRWLTKVGVLRCAGGLHGGFLRAATWDIRLS